MTTLTADKKKPSHRLAPVEGVVPTYEEKNGMSMTQTAKTDQAPDWRELLDDPKVISIIQSEARRSRSIYYDQRLIDDVESYLTVEAVEVAKGFRPDPTRPDPLAHWYSYFRAGLRFKMKHHIKTLYGEGAAAALVRGTYSIEAICDKDDRALDTLASTPIVPTGVDIDRSQHLVEVLAERGRVTVAELREALGIDRIRAIGLLIRAAKAGRCVRLAPGVYEAVTHRELAVAS